MFNWDQLGNDLLQDALTACEKFRQNAQCGIVTQENQLLSNVICSEIWYIKEKVRNCISEPAEQNYAAAMLLGAYPKTTINNPLILEKALGNAWKMCPKSIFDIVLNRIWVKCSFPPLTADLAATIQEVCAEIALLFSTLQLNDSLKKKIAESKKADAEKQEMDEWKQHPDYKIGMDAFAEILRGLGKNTKKDVS